MASRQGFLSNNNDPYVYQESNTGVSASLGIEDGSSTYKISISSSPLATPSSTAQIEINPTTNILTFRANTGTVLIATTAVLQIEDLNAGVMQTDATGVVSSSNGTNGQLLIGGGAAPVWANLTSSGGSVTITNGANSINLEASGVGGLTQLNGDTGSALPSGGVITIAGGNLLTTTAAASTVTVDVTGGTNGQVIVASTAGNPAFATLSSTGGTITYTLGANTLNIEGTPATTTQLGVVTFSTNAETIAGSVTDKATTPDDIKAKLGTQTNHGVLVGAGQTAAVTALAVGATNTVLLGNTGADPSFGTVPNAALTNSTITLNNGNNITITGSPISLGGAASIAVTGTTNHAMQIGNVSGSLTSLAVGTNGQVLLGATAADAAFATLTSSGGTITYTTGVNALNIDGTPATTTQAGVVTFATNAETIAGTVTNKAVTPDDLKAKLGTQTNHGVLVGAGTASAVTALAVGATNTVLLGNTGADPSFGTVPNAALTNSSITLNSGNNISVAGSPVSLGGAATISVIGTTNHAVQVGNASASLTSLTVGLNGQILIGATGLNPAFANMTSSDGSITITTGANTLDIKTAAAAGVSSVTGTANQVTASPTTGAVILSTPSTFIAPGSIEATTTITATLGDITATAGNLNVKNRLNTSDAAEISIVKSRLGGTITSGDNIGFIIWKAHDGTSEVVTSKIQSQSSGTIGTNRVASNLVFYTHPDSTTGSTPRMVINPTGEVEINAADSGTEFTVHGGLLIDGASTFTGNVLAPGIVGDVITSSATVLVNTSTGRLGTVVSSQRYKQDIKPMLSSPVLSMQPVTFRYKEAPEELHYGLIAEQVEQVMPTMVIYKDGQPETVRYHELPALLLAEIKRLRYDLDMLKESLNGK